MEIKVVEIEIDQIVDLKLNRNKYSIGYKLKIYKICIVKCINYYHISKCKNTKNKKIKHI